MGGRVAEYIRFRDAGEKIVQLATGPFRTQLKFAASYQVSKTEWICSKGKKCKTSFGTKQAKKSNSVKTHQKQGDKECDGVLVNYAKETDPQQEGNNIVCPHTAYWKALVELK